MRLWTTVGPTHSHGPSAFHTDVMVRLPSLQDKELGSGDGDLPCLSRATSITDQKVL